MLNLHANVGRCIEIIIIYGAGFLKKCFRRVTKATPAINPPTTNPIAAPVTLVIGKSYFISLGQSSKSSNMFLYEHLNFT